MELIGREGVVTGRIAREHLGEVVVQIRGGSEHFPSYSEDRSRPIEVGISVVVTKQMPNRTVVVREA